MTPTLAQLHDQVRVRVDSAITSALRADPAAIDAFLEPPPVNSAAGPATGSADGPTAELSDRPAAQPLDPHTLDFLREARRLVLACGAALSSVLGAHRPGPGPYGDQICRQCRTAQCRTVPRVAEVLAAYAVRPIAIDRAEAWRRADAWFAHDGRPVPLQLEEFDAGFAARPAVPVPAETKTLIVVDRRTGALSRWPDIPLTEVAQKYSSRPQTPPRA